MLLFQNLKSLPYLLSPAGSVRARQLYQVLRQHILFNQLLLGKIIKTVFSKHVCNLFLPMFPLPKNPILQIRPIMYAINREMNTQRNAAKTNLFPTKTIKVTNFTQS